MTQSKATRSIIATQTADAWTAQANEGTFTVSDFLFSDGETLRAVHLHYRTLGSPHRGPDGHIDNAVLLLHGTGGSSKSFLIPTFADVLFGPGQPLDIQHYYLIFPDEIGHGRIEQTLRRPAHALSALRLRRYGSCAAPACPGRLTRYVTQVTAIGPLGLEYVSAKDDPRNNNS